MARLPFETASVIPQQNRLSAPNIPNAPGPLDVSVPGAGAQNRALMSLGESIAKIGRTAADIYLTQAEKEKDEQAKIAIVQAGQFIDERFNEHLAEQRSEPAKDATEAMMRYDYFLNGAEGVGGLEDNEGTGLYQSIARQYKDAPKRVKMAVEELLKNKEIQTRHVLKIQAQDRNSAVQVGKGVFAAQQSLFNYEQDLTPDYFAGTTKMLDDEFQGVLGNDLNERIDSALEGLSPGQQEIARQRLQSYALQTAQGVIRARDAYIQGELSASFARDEVEILKSAAPREKRLMAYETLQIEKAKKGLIASDRVPGIVIQFENRLDESDFDRLKLEDPTGLLDKLQNDEDFLPTFRENRFQKILEVESYIRTRAREGEVAARKQLGFTIAAILSPSTSTLPEEKRAELESPATLETLVAALPEEQDRVIARGLHTYAIKTRNTLQDLPQKDILELTQIKETLRPPVFIDGVSNLDLNKFEQIYNVTLKAIDDIEERWKENGASFYQRAEGESPTSSSTLEAVVDRQLRYHKLDKTKNLTPRELRRLHQGGINGHQIRLVSDQDKQALGEDYRGTQSGAERQRFMNDTLADAGSTFSAMLMSELAMKEPGGIGLPYRSMLYTESSQPGTVENLYNAEINAKTNRENVRTLFGSDAGNSMQQVMDEIIANDDVRSFMSSFTIDPGAEAVRNEFQQFMIDYTLEMGRREIPLSESVDLMAQHLINDNYVFIQPNPETPPVRLKSTQLGYLPEGKMEEALTQYTEQLLADRRNGMIDLVGSDDLWAWKVRGDEKGLELVFLNENRGAQYSSRQIILPFDELKVITEKHMNGDADLFLSEQAKAEANEILDEKFGPPQREPEPVVEPEPAMATDRRSRALRTAAAAESQQPEEPEAAPPDVDLEATQAFLSRARSYLDDVGGVEPVVERLIEGADSIEKKLMVLGLPKTATEKRSRQKLKRELRLLETQLDLIQGQTASEEQIRQIVGEKREIDPETRKMLEDLLRKNK